MNIATITVKGVPIELRPSLKAAMRLHARFGLSELVSGVIRGKLSMIRALVEECWTNAPDSVDDRIAVLNHTQLLYMNPTPSSAMHNAFCAVALGLFGANESSLKDLEKDDKDHEERKPTDHQKCLDELFGIATGWFGWTPHEAYRATPAEIIKARDGRVQLLKLMFGSEDKPKAREPYRATTPKDMDAVAMRMFRKWGMKDSA